METESSASRSWRKGSTFSLPTCAAASPSNKARTTTASMSPCTIDAVGFVGNSPAMMSGPCIPEKAVSVLSFAPPVPPGRGPLPVSAAEAICAPGCSQLASITPVDAAATVVRTMNAARRKPIAFSSAPELAPVSPPTIDAKISGTRTIAIRPRNIWAGSASQPASSSAMAGNNMPMSGLSRMPIPSPASMPVTTCAQSRRLTQARNRNLWR